MDLCTPSIGAESVIADEDRIGISSDGKYSDERHAYIGKGGVDGLPGFEIVLSVSVEVHLSSLLDRGRSGFCCFHIHQEVMSAGSVDEKGGYDTVSDHAVSAREVDTGAVLVAGVQGDLDPAEGLRIRYVHASSVL